MFASTLTSTLAVVVLGLLSLQALALPSPQATPQPADDVTCMMYPRLFLYKYRVRLLGWGHHGPDGCGRGLLDNLNGQAAASTNWRCDWDAGADGINATAWFDMPAIGDNAIMRGSTTKVNYALRMAGGRVGSLDLCPN
ncbi:MAG: hypothetical protein M1832_003098 [Thelocarpon impressellum]|nr:MAG: hypothetical protein M1832_003098 [Thelocarpon impressellum]